MEPKRIILHHSLTEDGETVSWGAIRRYHVETMGWRDIGYHFGIEKIGGRYETLLGRMPGSIGAHTQGYNHDSLGICLVGNFDVLAPPREQWRAAVDLVRWLSAVYKIQPENIYGHRNFAPKTCPGTLFDMTAFRADVMKG
jgi:hypothetical protein